MPRPLSNLVCPTCGRNGGCLKRELFTKIRSTSTGVHRYQGWYWVVYHQIRGDDGKWKTKKCYVGKKKPKLEKK